ncbi:MAG: polysaccharide deacetylase family protein [Bacteroidota bacterium]
MLVVSTPSGYEFERSYAFEIVLSDFLGIKWYHEIRDGESICIHNNEYPGEIWLPDAFFCKIKNKWLNSDSLPIQPLEKWDSGELSSDISLVNALIPVIYGNKNPKARVEDNIIDLPIDIFGSTYFMLVRYEELVKKERDNHDRFPATASLAYQEGFLDRPIIDEYVEILMSAIQRLWPHIHRKQISNKQYVTCDVDSPYEVEFSKYAMLRGIAADVLKRRNPQLALKNFKPRWRAFCGNFNGDPHWENINWMMDVNEKAGNRVAFYFIAEHTHPYDARYRMDESGIRQLLHRINSRGHEIGLHPSYSTYLSPEQMQREAEILRSTLHHENISYAELGGRQHYLRWRSPQTARNWEGSGMSYDSTLTYADCPGFRCGTSRDYTMFDLIERKVMKLKQRPLVMMEGSIIADQYMAMGYTDEALKYMQTLKNNALSIGGQFTFLWHNSYFHVPEARYIYENLISQR